MVEYHFHIRSTTEHEVSRGKTTKDQENKTKGEVKRENNSGIPCNVKNAYK